MGGGDWGKAAFNWEPKKQHSSSFLLTQEVVTSHRELQMSGEGQPICKKAWLDYIRNCGFVLLSSRVLYN